MKMIIEIKENEKLNNGDILVYNEKECCFENVSKRVYFLQVLDKITSNKKEFDEFKQETNFTLQALNERLEMLSEAILNLAREIAIDRGEIND